MEQPDNDKRDEIVVNVDFGPTLLEMYRMRETMVGGGETGRRRTVAVSSIRIRIRGSADAVGVRPVLLDQIFRR